MTTPKNETHLRNEWVNFINAMEFCHATSIENHSMGPGTPDVHNMCDGSGFWIEFKHSGSRGEVEVKASQVKWIKKECKAGGRVFLICYDSFNDVYLILPGFMVDQVAGRKSMSVWHEVGATHAVAKDFEDILAKLRRAYHG